MSPRSRTEVSMATSPQGPRARQALARLRSRSSTPAKSTLSIASGLHACAALRLGTTLVFCTTLLLGTSWATASPRPERVATFQAHAASPTANRPTTGVASSESTPGGKLSRGRSTKDSFLALRPPAPPTTAGDTPASATAGDTAGSEQATLQRLAKESFERGEVAFRREEYAAAAAAFEQAARLAPHPAAWLNAAEAWERAREWARAAEACESARALNPPAAARSHIGARLRRLAPRLYRLILTGDTGWRVQLGPTPPVGLPAERWLLPGGHRLTAEHSLGATYEETIVADAGLTARRALPSAAQAMASATAPGAAPGTGSGGMAGAAPGTAPGGIAGTTDGSGASTAQGAAPGTRSGGMAGAAPENGRGLGPGPGTRSAPSGVEARQNDLYRDPHPDATSDLHRRGTQNSRMNAATKDPLGVAAASEEARSRAQGPPLGASIALGTGGAAAIATAVLGGFTLAARSAYKEAPSRRGANGFYDLRFATNVVLSAALLGIVVGGTWWLVDSSERSE